MSLHVEITQGFRVDNLQMLQDQIRLRGGRLIAYSEVISAFFISARSYKVKWVATSEERKRAGFVSTVITSLLGWWAIAGPYWTITSVIWNARGGYDITDALLRAHPGNKTLLGYSDAVALGTFQESASRIAIRILLGFAITVVLTIAFAIWYSSTQK